MANVGLFFVGAVLFLTGLMLLNKVDGRSSAVFSLFIGVLQVFTPIYLIVSSGGEFRAVIDAAEILLFGFTYLYVGLSTLLRLETNGAGWYCLWVAIMGIGFSVVHFSLLNDPKFGLLWTMWAFLWYLFYLLLVKKMPIEQYVGKVTLYIAWVTVIPTAFLSLIGLWEMVDTLLVLGVTILSFIYFVAAYWRNSANQASQQLLSKVNE